MNGRWALLCVGVAQAGPRRKWAFRKFRKFRHISIGFFNRVIIKRLAGGSASALFTFLSSKLTKKKKKKKKKEKN